jgi:hypothetical protein
MAPLRESSNALVFGDRTGGSIPWMRKRTIVVEEENRRSRAAARITGAAVVQEWVVYVPVASTRRDIGSGREALVRGPNARSLNSRTAAVDAMRQSQ